VGKYDSSRGGVAGGGLDLDADDVAAIGKEFSQLQLRRVVRHIMHDDQRHFTVVWQHTTTSFQKNLKKEGLKFKHPKNHKLQYFFFFLKNAFAV
jgi:hypothetical protein